MQTIGIIGSGRFGMLVYDTLLNKTKCSLKVYSVNEKVDNKIFFELGQVAACNMVIPCVPISEFKNVIKQISPMLQPGALLVDICSIKVHSTKVLLKLLSKDIDILSTHPMFGPDSSKNGTFFQGLQFIYYPTRIKNQEKLNSILAFLSDLKLNLIKMTPDDHDKNAAYSQAYSFLIGKIGMMINVRQSQIVTKGFEYLLLNQQSMENDTNQLFIDMQMYNPYAEVMRKEVLTALKKIEKDLMQARSRIAKMVKLKH